MLDNSEEWQKYLDTLSFENRAIEIKNKILDGLEDETSKQCFQDCFEYVLNLYKQNKPLEANLFRIHLEDIKGYKNIKLEEFIRIILLLSYCGFNISEN